MTAATRRAAFGAILAAPLASVPAPALTLPDHEARFLALVPQLAVMIPPIERAKARCTVLYEAADRQAGEHPGWANYGAGSAWVNRAQALRKVNGYHEAWAAWNDLAGEVDEMVDAFMRLPMTTLTALAWKARVAALLDCCQEEVCFDLAALAREGALCA